MDVTFKDGDGNTYTLPSSFRVKEVAAWPVRRRTSIAERSYADGGVEMADKRYKPRTIIISGKVGTDSWAALMSAFLRQYDKDELLELRYTQNRFAYVRMQDIDFDRVYGEEGGDRVGEYELRLTMADPYFYSNTQYSDDINIYYSATQFTVPNNGDMETFPVWSIAANADLPNILLRNVTDGNRVMYYQDTSLVAGTTVEIDTVNGIVERDNVDTIIRFSGTFLKLLQGDNVIQFETGVPVAGLDAVVTVTFRGRYLHPEGPDLTTPEILS